MDVRVLYTDIDGTLVGPTGNLLWTSDRTPTLAAAWALVQAHRAGLEVVALSGRARPGLSELARLLGLRTWFCELGASRMYDDGERVEATVGAYVGTRPVPEVLRPAVAELIAGSAGALEEHTPWNAGREHSVLVRGHLEVTAAQAWLHANGYDWVEISDNGILSRGTDTLPDDLPSARVYHLSPRGISKRDAIQADQALRGLDPAECAAVGDALADAACHAVVGRCFVVRNGVESDPVLADLVAATPALVVTRRGHTEGFAEAVADLLGLEPLAEG